MSLTALAAVLLYVLGAAQSWIFTNLIDEAIQEEGYEISPTGKAIMTLGWPVIAVINLFRGKEADNEGDE